MENLDLTYFFQTKSQAYDFSDRLSAISEKIYHNNFNLENELLEQFGLDKKDKFITFLRNSNINTNSANELKQFIDSLLEKITQIPILSISIAFNPSKETLKIISEWFLINAKKQIILDININPEIIGGAEVFFNGKHGNYSIKNQFDTILQTVIKENSKINQSSSNNDVNQLTA